MLVTVAEASTALTNAGCGTDYQEAKINCFFHLHLMDQDNNNLAPSNYVFPSKLKYSNIANATVKVCIIIGSFNNQLLFLTDRLHNCYR